MATTAMIGPAVAPENQAGAVPSRRIDDSVADDLGRMWGQEKAEPQPADEGAKDSANATPIDPRERRELGEAVADLDNPPGGDDGDRPAVDPVTGSQA
ncbi:MAG: hypothetical protein J0H01_17510 [Rhizobiales bacterium]|nr:hypothetical protein [Hyphomicrobiales bacterium]